mgnify:CR=1 FL=1
MEIYNIDTYYPPILEFVSSLNQERIIIVGHSLGSATSLYLASKLGSKITHLLLEDPPWFIEDKSQMSEHVKKETFFLEQKPKWKTVLDAIFDYQQYDPELFINNPYWATIRASYAFHHDIKIWDVELSEEEVYSEFLGENELDSACQSIQAMGGMVKEVKEIHIRDLEEARVLVVLEKIGPTPKSHPRRPGIPQKRPL